MEMIITLYFHYELPKNIPEQCLFCFLFCSHHGNRSRMAPISTTPLTLGSGSSQSQTQSDSASDLQVLEIKTGKTSSHQVNPLDPVKACDNSTANSTASTSGHSSTGNNSSSTTASSSSNNSVPISKKLSKINLRKLKIW